ncbi:hypothetical protein [Carboxylicivirga caseinilyticus]|uniref:GNAT family N-acetyltransferase n=1 Tax=Carboxylicivirga caseinilyticus TaxID=3417572 RepID=UPI002AA6DEF5|nr:hypothetical protein [uncultured Carboxylicivirga sp.]MCU4166228.1 hypothetical protein [Marinilabiliaceae bacterium A049]
MEKLLLFIKHRLVFIWHIIEWINGLVFYILHHNSLKKTIHKVFSEELKPNYEFRILNAGDAEAITMLLNHQKKEDMRYFNPHGFDLISIKRQLKKKAFLMMGVFEEERLVGYFFLRFFANKKCFVGRVIDFDYRGRGIGGLMNRIMYNIAWELNFKCLSTISKNNQLVINAHRKNSNMKIVKELPGDYLLIEFVK